MTEEGESIERLGGIVARQRKVVTELISLLNYSKNADTPAEKRMVSSQIEMLRYELRKVGNQINDAVEKISMFKPLKKEEGFDEEEYNLIPVKRIPEKDLPQLAQVKGVRKVKPDPLEKLTLSRMKKKDKKISHKKERKPRRYVKFASKMFHNISTNFINKGKFKDLSRNLIKANMEYVPAAYVSVIFFTTLLSIFVAIFIALFFLFFSIVALPPFIVPVEENIVTRFLKVFWVLFAIPAATFIFTYFYPSMEKKSIENRINQEIPFAVVHMSAISSSMIEPSKIFNIIISTREYPALEKEFIKIQNEINVYGYDLVTSLRNRSFNSPSKKLAELFNGLATTINSGGDLPNFFEKRSQSLLFDHRLEKEKQTKASETFMDVYISAVVAAPMILMLLLMMMRISGLGISLSTGMISLIMILGVSLINIMFLAFLHLRQPEGA